MEMISFKVRTFSLKKIAENEDTYVTNFSIVSKTINYPDLVVTTDRSFRREMNVFNWTFLIGTLSKLCCQGFHDCSVEKHLETKL